MISPIQITDTLITVEAQFFVTKNLSFINREAILDIFTKFYCGQHVKIVAFDGENLSEAGFIRFLDQLCSTFNISPDLVTIEGHTTEVFAPYNQTKMSLGIFNSTKKYAGAIDQYQLNAPKFVGTVLGRFNFTRLRLAYELDCAFPNDTYIVFQPNATYIKQFYKSYSELYSNEFAWLATKEFNRDITTATNDGEVNWWQAISDYANVWPNYQIEIVVETDSLSSWWLTEKTAKCLVTGKPFILIGGQGILQQVRNLGYKTFSAVLDESYDQATTPTARILTAINSLKQLYNSPDRDARIAQMYQIAQKNITKLT